MNLQELLNKISKVEGITAGDIQNINDAVTEIKAKAVHGANDQAALLRAEVEGLKVKLEDAQKGVKELTTTKKELEVANKAIEGLNTELAPFKTNAKKETIKKTYLENVKPEFVEDVLDLIMGKDIINEEADEKANKKAIDEFLNARKHILNAENKKEVMAQPPLHAPNMAMPQNNASPQVTMPQANAVDPADTLKQQLLSNMPKNITNNGMA